ncbi:MAG: hypothetical protein IKE53_07335 [Clostridiales bacterium]|nr:hypothetical protein [Clostridiales bacterium]
MKRSLAKICALILTAVMAISAVSCSAGGDNADQAGQEQEQATITSDWEFYSVTTDGNTSYASEALSNIVGPEPSFSSEDGETFTLTITGDKQYHGTITENEDGTWELHNGDNPNTLNVSISGNELTVHITDSKYLVFRTEK